jgi:hypothetical protein
MSNNTSVDIAKPYIIMSIEKELRHSIETAIEKYNSQMSTITNIIHNCSISDINESSENAICISDKSEISNLTSRLNTLEGTLQSFMTEQRVKIEELHATILNSIVMRDAELESKKQIIYMNDSESEYSSIVQPHLNSPLKSENIRFVPNSYNDVPIQIAEVIEVIDSDNESPNDSEHEGKDDDEIIEETTETVEVEEDKETIKEQEQEQKEVQKSEEIQVNQETTKVEEQNKKEDENEEEEIELEEVEENGKIYYKDTRNIIYSLTEDGELSDPVGKWSQKRNKILFF